MLPADVANLRPTLDLLLKLDGSRCAICLGSIEVREDASLDHIVPQYHKGPDRFWNLRVAHTSCNSRRGHRLPRPAEIRWDRMQPLEADEARHVIRRALGWMSWPEGAWPPGTQDFLCGRLGLPYTAG